MKNKTPQDKRFDYQGEDGPITEETRQRLLQAWKNLNPQAEEVKK